MRYLFYTALLLLLAGCDSGSSSRAVNDIHSTLSSLAKKVDEVAPSPKDLGSMTSEQINKLFAIEYRILTIEGELAPDKLQSVLSAAGKERWDCYNVQQAKGGTHVFCKRLPLPYLRYALPFL